MRNRNEDWARWRGKFVNRLVRRNIYRFPEDFAFQLAKEELANLKSQVATSSSGWGGGRKSRLAFTEHGALQAANLPGSELSVEDRSANPLCFFAAHLTVVMCL